MDGSTFLLYVFVKRQRAYGTKVAPDDVLGLQKMKKLFLWLSLAMVPVLTYCQNAEKELTKFEAFTSNTGKIIKFYDVTMPNISTFLGGKLNASIRVVQKGTDKMFFYRIEKAETSSSNARKAMIEYSDLVEINKAIATLCMEQPNDEAAGRDYLENKFISDDGFQVGYYISGKTTRWYVQLERYSSSTVFFSNKEALVEAFSDAQKRIEEIKD